MDRIDIHQERVMAMVLILDGNLLIGVHMWDDLDFFYLFKGFV